VNRRNQARFTKKEPRRRIDRTPPDLRDTLLGGADPQMLRCHPKQRLARITIVRKRAHENPTEALWAYDHRRTFVENFAVSGFFRGVRVELVLFFTLATKVSAWASCTGALRATRASPSVVTRNLVSVAGLELTAVGLIASTDATSHFAPDYFDLSIPPIADSGECRAAASAPSPRSPVEMPTPEES
jgi:hypothetical protein